MIATAGELNSIGCNPRLMKAHFKLVVDVDLKDVEFLAIGSEVFPFTGAFDGNGHTISHLTRISTTTDYAGLFAYVDGLTAEVKNLGLIAPIVDTQTEWSVGTLVGRLDSGRISNCYVQDGQVAGATAGGLVGLSSGVVIGCRASCSVSGSSGTGGVAGTNSGTVINCTSSGSVSGNMYAGGLVGTNRWGGEVTGCSATGNVSAKGASAGGLVGDNTGRIINCYARGSVSGNVSVGGLVGSNGYIQTRDVRYEAPGEITNCYSTGTASGTSSIGGLVGLQIVGPVVSCFWDIQTSGQTTSAAGVGKTTSQMQDIQTYLGAGWDFVGESQNGTSELWQMPAAGGYPILSVSANYAPPHLAGSGTPDDPYLVSNAMELGVVAHYSSCAHYRLTVSLDLSGIRWSTAVIPWFDGTFDGRGYTISHLTIQGGSCLGLFGQISSGAQVENLAVLDVNIVGSTEYVGGLVAVNAGTVTDCSSTGAISSRGPRQCSYLGGLVGSNSGAVTQCHSTATVDGTSSDVGGLVGYNQGLVAECYSTGAVSVIGSDVGGLAGSNGGTVTQCYATGTVSGNSDIGGLVGGNYLNGVLTQCYSTGGVSGTYYNVGGLVGWNVATVDQCYSIGAVSGKDNVAGLVWGSTYSGSVTACFWDTQTSGQAVSVAGTGLPTSEMQKSATYLNAGWDFVTETKNGTDDIWWIDEGKDYPRLWWEAAER